MPIKSRFLIAALLPLVLIYGCSGGGRSKDIAITNWQVARNAAGAEKPAELNNWLPYEGKSPINRDVLLFNIAGDETVWLRGEFTMPETPVEPYGIIIGGRGSSARVFINSYPLERPEGRKIENIYAPAAYEVPAGCLKRGPNTILLRTALMGGHSAVARHVSILASERFSRLNLVHELVYNQLPMAILVFNFSLLFPPLIFFLWFRRMRVLGASAVVLLAIIVYILLEFIPRSYLGALTPRVHLAMIPVFGIVLFASIQSLYRIYITFFFRMIAVCCATAVALILAVNKTLSEIYAPIVMLGGICTLVPAGLFMFNSISKFRRDRTMFFIMNGFIVFTALIGAYEVVAFMWDGSYVFLAVIYSSPVFIIVFIVLIAREFMRRIVRMEILYQTIKDSEKKGNNLSITDSTESKLNSIIDFINQNYTQDISREGLAGAIDISTDYMSRLFKTYTGKKINEYINELRVRDAMRKLQDRNIKIIDVALSVGFESLSTFNRAFKLVNGMTPSDYRKQS